MKLLKLTAVVFAIMLTSCSAPNSNQVEYNQQETAVKTILSAQPVPQYSYSVERAQAITLMNIRNMKMFSTFSYIVTINGEFIKICNSRGFGIPYAVQLTNPLKLAFPYNSESAVVANPDPNMLYYPSSADATWIMCIDSGKDGSYVLSPQYIEDKVEVLTFEVAGAKELKRVGQSSVTINEVDLLQATSNAISTTVFVTSTVK